MSADSISEGEEPLTIYTVGHSNQPLVGLRLGGFEGNPLFNSLFSWSAVTASLLKLAGTLLLTTILLTTFSTMPRLTRRVTAFLCLILAVFVANDIWTVARLLAH